MKPKVDPQILEERIKASLQRRWPEQRRNTSQAASIIDYIDKKSRRHSMKIHINSTVRLIGLAALILGLLAVIRLSMKMLAPTPANNATGIPSPTPTQAVLETIFPTETPTLSADNSPVVIKFVAWDYERALYEPLMAKFHEEYPSITVEFVAKAEDNDEPRLHASSGDTVLVNGSRVMEKIYFDYYRDVTSLMDADPNFDAADFWGGALNACKSNDGRQLGIPLFINPDGIFYHKEAFDAAGVPYPKPGWTWDDMRESITALARTDGDLILQYGFAGRTTYLLSPLIENLTDKNEIDIQALQQEVQWYIDLFRAKAIYYPTSLGEDGQMDWEKESQVWQDMFTGEHPPAMWVGSIADIMLGREWMGDPSDPLANLSLKTEGFVPFPIAADGTFTNTTPLYVQCVAISDATQHPSEAWLWVDFLSRQHLVEYEDIPSERLKLPARISVAEAYDYWSGLPSDLRETLEFSVAHAWFRAPYTEREGIIDGALEQAIWGGADFVTAVEDGLRGNVPSETIPTPVETPQTQSHGFPVDIPVLIVRSDERAADPGAMVSALGYSVQSVFDKDFRLMSVEQLLEYSAVFYIGATPPDTLPFLIAYLDAGGSLYISDYYLGRDLGETDFYKTYLQATFQLDSVGDLVRGEDFMLGLGVVEFVPGVIPEGFIVGAEGTRIFRYVRHDYAAGVAVNRNGYKAVYTAFNFTDAITEDGVIDVIREIMKYLTSSGEIP